jgi:poly-gamma-glutamate synthase PgsB/CapB
MSAELLAAGALGLVGLGAIESFVHRRALRRFKHRIHVAGTRGKSSVTRLVAAGLRESGVRTAAKTTGTLARMILPDARELPIYRPRGANIVEQIRIVRAAAALEAEAIVLECMALQPALHWLSERMLVRATAAILTNARPDHLELMGPTADDVARCLAGMIPPRGLCVVGERDPARRAIFAAACKDREAVFVPVEEEDVRAVRDDDLARFRHVEHRENVAVALKLLAALEVPRDLALAGMWKAEPDPGALTEHVVQFFGRRIVFVNAFAANDPQSTEHIWRMTLRRHADADKVIAVFNLRADRADRTRQLAAGADFWHHADHVVLMGSGAYHFAREAERRAGVGLPRFTFADGDEVGEVFEAIVELCARRTLVVGVGNLGEGGPALARHFKNRRDLSLEVG